MANQLAEYDYESGDVLMTKDIADMSAEVASGRVDLVTTTLFEAISLIDAGVGELAAIKWKNGVSHYSSVIVTKHALDINSTADLVGKNITFEDPNSASGFFLVYLALATENHTLVEVTNETMVSSSRIEDGISFQFSYSNKNALEWLLNGKTDAIVVSDLDWQDIASDYSEEHNLKVIFNSELIPRGMEIVRANLPEPVKETLIDSLHSMHLDSDAGETMSEYHQTTRLTRPTPSDTQLMEMYISQFRSVKSALSAW